MDLSSVYFHILWTFNFKLGWGQVCSKCQGRWAAENSELEKPQGLKTSKWSQVPLMSFPGQPAQVPHWCRKRCLSPSPHTELTVGFRVAGKERRVLTDFQVKRSTGDQQRERAAD